MSQEMFFFFDQLKVAIQQEDHKAILRFSGSMMDSEGYPLQQFERLLEQLAKLNDNFLVDLRMADSLNPHFLEFLIKMAQNNKKINFLTQGKMIEEQLNHIGFSIGKPSLDP